VRVCVSKSSTYVRLFFNYWKFVCFKQLSWLSKWGHSFLSRFNHSSFNFLQSFCHAIQFFIYRIKNCMLWLRNIIDRFWCNFPAKLSLSNIWIKLIFCNYWLECFSDLIFYLIWCSVHSMNFKFVVLKLWHRWKPTLISCHQLSSLFFVSWKVCVEL